MIQGTIETAPLIADKKKQALMRYRDLYPGLLTIALFALQGAAIVNGVRTAAEPSARYWIGPIGYITLSVPLIVVFAHMVQSYFQRPIYLAVVFSCAIPPLVFLVVGYIYFVPVTQIVERLMSTDCITFKEKFEIELGYRSAVTFYDECVLTQAINRSMTEEDIRKDLVIEACPHYKESRVASGYERQWDYLKQLELSQKCSGWCSPGETSIWTRNPAGWDGCSTAAGQKLKDTVARNALRMMMNGLIGFLCAGIAIFAINEWIHMSDDPTLHW